LSPLFDVRMSQGAEYDLFFLLTLVAGKRKAAFHQQVGLGKTEIRASCSRW
jgi:hypothetical protein